jgi:hypothetical protein
MRVPGESYSNVIIRAARLTESGAKRSKDTFDQGRPALRISNFECDSLERRRCKTFAQKIRLSVFDKPLRRRRRRGSKGARVTEEIWAADHLAVAQAVHNLCHKIVHIHLNGAAFSCTGACAARGLNRPYCR